MATEEILLKYRADITDLQAKVVVIEASLRKVDTAVNTSAKNTAGLIETAKNRLTQLQAAREKAYDPQKIVRFNSLIEQQSDRIKALTGTQQKVTSGFQNLGNALAPLGAAIAGAFAVNQIIAFGKESVKAFQDAELSAKKLFVVIIFQTR